jgi:hypothetical protein
MRRNRKLEQEFAELPGCVIDYVRRVVKMIGYRRKVRRDVEAELLGHFADALRHCPSPQDASARAEQLVAEFGDAQLLARLCRRAKKRCRPVWVRALARATQVVGVFLLVFTPYTVWFVRGKPHPTIDYLPQLNVLNQPAGRIEDNAWPHYERALRLLVEPNETIQNASWFKSLTPGQEPLTLQERAHLARWVAINSAAWLQFEIGAAKGYCRRTYRRLLRKPLIMSFTDDPPLANLRSFAQMSLWKSRLAVEQGRTDEGLSHCLTLMRAGAHLETNAFMIEELIAYAVGAQACWEIRAILSSNELSASQLSWLQAQVADVRRDGYPALSFEGERLAVLDGIEYEFTHGGIGGGHHIVGPYTRFAYEVLEVPDTPKNWTFRIIVMPIDVAASMIHAGRTRTIAKANQIYDRMSEMARHSPHERRVHGIAGVTEGIGRLDALRYGYVYLLLPAERRASAIQFQAKADHQALVTILAIKRYRLETGGYQPGLKTLVDAGYLNKLPMDPFSDRALVYRLAGESFLLYSVGRDFKDDGGQFSRGKHGRPTVWADNGDAVFWPVNP